MTFEDGTLCLIIISKKQQKAAQEGGERESFCQAEAIVAEAT